MRVVLAVALDVLREAAARRWFQGLGAAISLVVLALGAGLQMEVIDGALAATSFFGSMLSSSEMTTTHAALEPVFKAVAYVMFYGGLTFGCLSCADFGPELLAPGRIEHLLSLPVRRWELLLGTFVGVFTLGTLLGLYGALCCVALFSWKAGVWGAGLLGAAALASASFAAIYAVMLAGAVFVRSSALSAALGGALLIAGVVAGYRDDIAPVFSPGLGRSAFELVTAPLPRLSRIADEAALVAVGKGRQTAELFRMLAGAGLFAGAALALGLWRFEQKDF
jgi:Cu-processing system permease protein